MKDQSCFTHNINKLHILFSTLSNTFRHIACHLTKTEKDKEVDEIVLSDKRDKPLFRIPPHNLICVAAEANYVDVFYIGEAGLIEHQFFRLTLKRTGEMCYPHLIQCHRSFLVNPMHIIKFNENSRNMFIRIYKPEQISIPVSPSHLDDVRRILDDAKP